MGRTIDFHLGHPSNLSSRRLQIFRLDAGGATRTSVHDNTEAGSAEVVSVELDENLMYEAILTDARGGDTFKPTIIKFSTGDDMLRGQQQSGGLRILHYTDTSSNSSTSTLSSSSSSSTSSLSSSSSSTSTLSSSTSSLSSLSSSSS